jgi:hypothetical protein
MTNNTQLSNLEVTAAGLLQLDGVLRRYGRAATPFAPSSMQRRSELTMTTGEAAWRRPLPSLKVMPTSMPSLRRSTR